jgi:hypothetical protein
LIFLVSPLEVRAFNEINRLVCPAGAYDPIEHAGEFPALSSAKANTPAQAALPTSTITAPIGATTARQKKTPRAAVTVDGVNFNDMQHGKYESPRPASRA